MGKFAFGVFINHSQQEVFDFLSDPANLSKWSSAFELAHWTSTDAPGVGATYQCLLKFYRKAATQKVETTEYAVNKKISYESEATRIAQAKVSIQFESVADGTKITSQRALAMTYHSFSG